MFTFCGTIYHENEPLNSSTEALIILGKSVNGKWNLKAKNFPFFNPGHLCVVFKTQIDEGNNMKSVSN